MTGKRNLKRRKNRYTVVGQTAENQFDAVGGRTVYSDITTRQIVVEDTFRFKYRFKEEGTTIYEEE